MTTQILLPLIPREGLTPKPVEDLLAVIVGLLQSYGYSDQYTVLENGGWHPVSEKPPEDGDYWVYSTALFPGVVARFYDPGWLYYYAGQTTVLKSVTHWQPLPEPPETKEDNDNERL